MSNCQLILGYIIEHHRSRYVGAVLSLAVSECAVVKSPRTVNELLPELLFEVFDLIDLDYSRVFCWYQVFASSLIMSQFVI